MSTLDPTPAFDDDNASLFAALGLVATARGVLDAAHRAACAPAAASDDDDDVMLAALGAIRLATRLLAAMEGLGVEPAEAPGRPGEAPVVPAALLR